MNTTPQNNTTERRFSTAGRGKASPSPLTIAKKILVPVILLAAPCTPCAILPAQESAEPATGDTARPAISLVTAVVGGFKVSGNKGKFQQDFGVPANGFTGIEQLTITKAFDDTSRIDIVGRALARQADYLIGATYTKDEWFKIDAGYKQFRTWYDGSAGYFGPTNAFYTLRDNILHTDRGELWFEAATLFPDKPNVTLRYERNTRKGTKSTTVLGDTTQPGGAGTKSIASAFNDLNETIDTLTLDIDQQKDAISWGGGVRYQHTKVENDLYSSRGINSANERVSDTATRTTSDLFSAHAYVTADITKKLSCAAGGLVTSLDTDIGGSRVYYSGSEPLYDPGMRIASSADYTGLGGGGKYKQYVANANLTWKPTKNWIIVPALRMENYRTDNVAEYYATLNPGETTPLRHVDSKNKWFELTESVEARYGGFKNWTHNFNIEFLQGTGSLDETLYNNYAIADPVRSIYRDTDQDRFTQKYSYSAHWYAKPGLSFSGQYYYKNNTNKNDTPADRDSTTSAGDRYPAWIAKQGFKTHDFNIRATWRPVAGLSLVTRYDYQISTIKTRCQSGDQSAPWAESSKSTTHIISESISATPHPRLWLLATASLVFDQLKSPVVNNTNGVIQSSDNNYFNGSLGAMFVATDLDDISLDYTYYKTDNFSNNSALGLPYGGSERQHVVTLGWTRRVTSHLNFTLRYIFADYKDKASGGHRDYTANGIHGRIQYQF